MVMRIALSARRVATRKSALSIARRDPAAAMLENDDLVRAQSSGCARVEWAGPFSTTKKNPISGVWILAHEPAARRPESCKQRDVIVSDTLLLAAGDRFAPGVGQRQ